jgi:hypothetical protein
MRKQLLFIFLIVGALGSFSSNCGGSESRQAAKATPSSREFSADLALLRSLAGSSFEATSTEHFTIIHEVGADGIADTGRALEAARLHFYDVFAKAGFELARPQERFVWICFPQQGGFNRYAEHIEGMDLSWLDGYYSTRTNRVAVVQPSPRMVALEQKIASRAGNRRIVLAAGKQQDEGVLAISSEQHLDITRLTHELAHQLAFNSGLQTRGVMYPVWVSEGLATNFESSDTTSAGLALPNLARGKCLATAFAEGELIPLREFVVQTRVPSGAQESRQHYAQAWGLFRFLLTERPRQLQAYLHRTANLRVGRRDSGVLLREFTAAFGTPDVLEPAWMGFVARLAQEFACDSRVAAMPMDPHSAGLK